MSLKYKYLLFIVVLHSAMVLLVYQLLEDKKWMFLGTEVLIIISLYLSYSLYKGFIKPIEMMQSGTDAIADADFSIKYIKTGSKDINQLIETYNTMIDQLREERTLMTGQSYFIRNLIEVTPLGIIIMDYDGRLTNVNPAARKLIGIDEYWKGKMLNDYSSEFVDALESMSIGRSNMLEFDGIEKYKCQINEVVHQGFKRKFILIDDLSTEMLKTQKEAYGKIIRMMAHEVNNSIGAVNSILDTVVEFGFDDIEDPALKDSLVLAKERNIGLSQFMANYASILRLPPAHLQTIDLAQLIKKSGQLFMPKAAELSIDIKFDIPNHLVSISGDKLLLEQAFSNIIKNGIESIGSYGEIQISLTEDPVEIVIADNGAGISPEVEPMLFTPFYSTKPTGQGVGLMLIRDILISHQSQFSLKTLDGWTKFRIGFNS